MQIVHHRTPPTTTTVAAPTSGSTRPRTTKDDVLDYAGPVALGGAGLGLGATMLAVGEDWKARDAGLQALSSATPRWDKEQASSLKAALQERAAGRPVPDGARELVATFDAQTAKGEQHLARAARFKALSTVGLAATAAVAVGGTGAFVADALDGRERTRESAVPEAIAGGVAGTGLLAGAFGSVNWYYAQKSIHPPGGGSFNLGREAFLANQAVRGIGNFLR